jgi:hypothetical protein
MGDIPPPNALYPQPSQPQNNSLFSDPAKIVGVMSGLNQIQIQKQAQQEHARQSIGSAFSNAISGLGKNATAEDVHNITANIARQFPQITTQYPDLIPATKDIILNSKRGDINYGANVLKNSVLSGGEGTNRVEVTEPRTGEKYTVPVPTANMGGALLSGLPPATGQAEEARVTDLKREGDLYPREINNLKQALHYAQSLPPTAFGPLSKNFNDFKSRMLELGVIRSPEEAKKITNFEAFDKYMADVVSTRANSLGPHTNEGLNSAYARSPNSHQAGGTILDLLRKQIALRHMEHAGIMLPAQNAPVGKYPEHKAQFGSTQDPAAYALETMTPDEVKALEKSLKDPSARSRFNKNYQDAIRAGILKRPGE